MNIFKKIFSPALYFVLYGLIFTLSFSLDSFFFHNGFGFVRNMHSDLRVVFFVPLISPVLFWFLTKFLIYFESIKHYNTWTHLRISCLYYILIGYYVVASLIEGTGIFDSNGYMMMVPALIAIIMNIISLYVLLRKKE